MKLVQIAALIFGASALRLEQKPMHLAHKPTHMAHKPVHLAHKQWVSKLLAKKHLFNKVLAKDMPELDEMADWVTKELNKDGGVTWDEVEEALHGWEKKADKEISEKEWELIGASWHYADIDDSGVVDGKELKCVIENVDCGSFGEIGAAYKHPSEEDLKRVEKWVEERFKEDGDISWDELEGAVKPLGLLEKQMDLLHALFDYVDEDDSGAVEEQELEAFLESL